MVNNEIWLDSQATVSMIPEQDIYLGAFNSGSVSGDNYVITLNSTFQNNFALVANLYRGCILDIYDTATDTLQDRTRIQSNDATSLTVLNSLESTITGTITNYYGVIHHYGAPVPGRKGSGGSTTHTAQVLNIQFKSDTASDYDDFAIIFGTLQSAGGTEDAVVIKFASDGSYGGAISGEDDTITVDFDETELTTAEEFIDAVINAINLKAGIDFTAARSSDSLVLTNSFGGAITRTASLDDGGGDSTLASPDVPSASTIELTVTTTGATVAGSGTNPRLLSDTWFGLANSITVPTTSTEAKQINVGIGGTRNFTYQFKGAETTSDFSLTTMANSVPWLYYALGSCAIPTGGNPGSATAPSADGFTFGTSTGFLYRTAAKPGDNLIHRVDNGKISPPYNDLATAKLLGDGTTALTYTISESDSSDLPSFAVEYTLKKPGNATTVATDANKETVYSKIYPGCTVSQLVLTAAAGQELECQVTAMPKKTFIAPTNYDTLNGKTDVAEFINFGTRNGEDTSAPTTMEPLMRPFFFSDGTVELFGQSFLKIENMTLTIDNGLQQKRFIGRYDKRSQETFAGQRTYNLTFSAMVTDGDLFDHFRQEHAFSLSGSGSGSAAPITLRFTKENSEEILLKFKDYHVTAAEFPLTNDNSPIMVNFTVVPLALQECVLQTYWAIQG